MNTLTINPKTEVVKITNFIRNTLKQQGFKNAILAVSGGIDSTTSLYLLVKALPPKNIFVAHMPYYRTYISQISKSARSLGIPSQQILEVDIKDTVDAFAKATNVGESSKLRFGNIMARTRMIILYDLAKKYQALVCGTENRSEYHLAYFTRFGDEASDFEPIRHLFKTQVYQLAKHLGVPKEIIVQSPTAGLWHGQTDEGEFGFTYEEADNVLYRYFDQKMTVSQIENEGFKNAKKIIERVKKNNYKHQVPYILH